MRGAARKEISKLGESRTKGEQRIPLSEKRRGSGRPSTAATISASLVIALASLVLAFFLRFHLLGAQSFWNDEGNSARIAERSLRLILEGAAGDIHPPGYYLALAGWRALAGESEFALRSLSAVAGVALVALVWQLGRRYFDPPAATAAALFAAAHPALIYYGQEARMYSLAAALGAATFLWMTLWLRATRLKPQDSGLKIRATEDKAQGAPTKASGRQRLTFYVSRFAHHASRITRSTCLALAYILTAVLGLYTHYSFAFVLLAVNLAALGGMAFHRRQLFRRRGVRWFAMQLAVLVLCAPWLPTAVRQLITWPSAREYAPFGQALTGAARWLALGPTIDRAAAVPGLIGAAVLLVLALRRRGQTITPLLWLIVPSGLTLGLGLFSEAFAKFLLVAVPAMCLFMGQGAARFVAAPLPARPGRAGKPASPAISRIEALAAGLCAGLVIGGMFAALRHLYYDPAYTRDDYRSIARLVEADARPGDAVLLNAANQWEVFTYYHREGAPVYPIPGQRPPDQARTRAELAEIAADSRRLFVLWWGEAQADPARLVETWLGENAFKAQDEWHGDLRLSLYATSQQPIIMDTPTAAQFGAAITLEGYTVYDRSVSPGDIVRITLFWRYSGSGSSHASALPAYKVFVHLTAPDGFPVAQHDGEPAAGLRPTSGWADGEQVVDNHGVLIPPDLPPGEYRLVVGMYGVAADERLSVRVAGQASSTSLPLGVIEVSFGDDRSGIS